MEYPAKLQEILDTLEFFSDQNERIQYLIEFAEKYNEVPESIAVRPYPGTNKIEYCESEAYVWVDIDKNEVVKLYFAVENPSGISAKALAAILDESLNGEKTDSFKNINTDLVFEIFGKNLSMGKNLGLTGIILKIKSELVRLNKSN